MTKRKKNVKVLHLSSVENTLRQMPKYNPYQTGHGSHGDRAYNRRKNKEQLRREIHEAGFVFLQVIAKRLPDKFISTIPA